MDESSKKKGILSKILKNSIKNDPAKVIILQIADDLEKKIDNEIKRVEEAIPYIHDGYTPIKDVDYFDGSNGKDGTNGIDGKDGEKGNKGDIGERGEVGLSGIDGIDGKNGVNGSNGIDGKDGEDGSSDTPEVIADKLNSLTEVLSQDVIQGFPDLKKRIEMSLFNPTMGPSFADLENLRTLIKNNPSSGGTPGGSNTDVQFNDMGSFDGNPGFTYASGKVNIGSLALPLSVLNLDGGNNYGVLTFSDIAHTTSQAGIGVESADDSIIVGGKLGDLSIYGGTGKINFSADFGSTDQMVLTDTGLLGVGITSGLVSGGTFKAPSQTVTAPSTLTITPHVETLADNPTLTVASISGPDDSSTAGLTGTQNDFSGIYTADTSVNILGNIYAYVTVAGSEYYLGSPSTFNFTDNGDTNSFGIGYTWGGVTGASGYVFQSSGSSSTGNPNFTIDLGNVTSFTDDGTNTATDPIPGSFNSLNPFVNGTAPNPFNSVSAGEVNIGGGGYTENGSTYFIEVDSLTVINSTNYVSGSPTTTSFADLNNGQTFDIQANWTDTGGTESNGIYRVSTDNATWTYHYTSSLSTYTDTNTANDPTAQSDWGRTYSSGISRQADAYGVETSPITHYSPSFSSYSYSDTNSPNGWVFVHSLTYGTTLTAKVLGSPSGSGFTNSYTTSATTMIESSSGFWTGDNTVAPVHYGYLSSGQTYSFEVYSEQTSPSVLYSMGHADNSYTFPNDSVYRYLTLSWTNGGGSQNKVLRDTGGGFTEGYITSSNTFNMYNGNPTFTDGVTVTPNTTEGSALTALSSAKSISDSPQFIIKSDATGMGVADFTKMEYRDSTDSVLLATGTDATTTSAYTDIKYTSGLYIVKAAGSEYLRHSKSFFNMNQQLSNSFSFQLNSDTGGQPLILADVGTRSVGINGNGSQPNNSKFYIYARSSSDQNLFLAAVASQTVAIQLTGLGNGAILTADGRWMINKSSATAGTSLAIGGQSTSNAGMVLESGSLKTSLIASAIENDGTRPSYTNSAASLRSQFLITGTSSQLATNKLPKADSSGRVVDSGISDDGTTIVMNEAVEFKQNITIDSGRNTTYGNNSGILGNIVHSYNPKTANFTLSPSNDFFVNATSNSFNFTLPTAVGRTGQIYELFNQGTGVITINTTSSQTVNGIATATITMNQNQGIQVISNGANWLSLGVLASSIVGTLTGSQVTGSALTKTDDTNVTLTLGGTPTTALLNAASLTLGWTGTLAASRGGTGASSLLGAGLSTTTSVQLTNQGADIATANLATVAGLYLVSYSLQDTTADLTAGAAILTISYADGAGAGTATATQVLTGLGRQSGSVYVQLASGNLTYAVSHTGLFGTSKYALFITTVRYI